MGPGPRTPAPQARFLEVTVERTAEVKRKTAETSVHLRLNLDGTGKADVVTGVGFLDHMLTLFARHGMLDLFVRVEGDLHVDAHHTVEDTGLVLGEAIRQAVGDKRGIARYGSFLLPMEEALVACALDLSGRPCLGYQLPIPGDRLGEMPVELVEEFFKSVCNAGLLNLHLVQMAGANAHHIAEAAFKGFGRCLDQATRLDDRSRDVPSTKGVL